MHRVNKYCLLIAGLRRTGGPRLRRTEGPPRTSTSDIFCTRSDLVEFRKELGRLRPDLKPDIRIFSLKSVFELQS